MPPKGSLLQAHIEGLKLDDATYAVVIKALPRLRQILREANKRGLTRFVCGLGLGFSPLPLQIMLQDAEGNAYRPSISLQRVCERPKEEEIGLETAFLFMAVVENVLWRFAGMAHIAAPKRLRELA